MGWSDEQKIKLVSLLTPEQRGLLDDITTRMRAEFGEGIDAYPEQIVPGMTPGQRDAFDEAQGELDRYGRQRANEAAALALMSGDPAFEVDSTARRELYEAEKAEAMRDFRQEVLPTIMRQYGARNAARSGGLEGALGRAGHELSEDLYRRNTELLYADEQAKRAEAAAARDRQAVGIQADALGRRADVDDIVARVGIGNLERGIEGQGNEEAYAKWLSTQPYYNPWLGFMPAALGTRAQVPVIKNVEGTASKIGSGMQVGGSAVGAIASMFSSREWKERVAAVDRDEILARLEALPIDRWRYDGHVVELDQREHVGTYAEDFRAAFGLGDGETIDVVDAVGVLMASVQALAARVRELEATPVAVEMES